MSKPSPIAGREHWTSKGDVRLFLWQKRAAGPSVKGTVLFVHGSSMASQPTFDLDVPGRPDSSVMDWFAARGFDTWCVDMEGYGRSDKTRPIDFDIANGADDLAAASEYIMKTGDSGPLLVYGISSGALRAAVFAERHPERVKRLALDAFVWTGEGSPTLAERRKKLPEFQARNRRPIDKAFVYSIFNRDHPGTAEDRVIEAFADAILALDELGADRHLRRHVLEAADGRSGPDRGAHPRHARAMGRDRQLRRPRRVLPPPAPPGQAVRRHAGHLARFLPAEELPRGLPHPVRFLLAAGPRLSRVSVARLGAICGRRRRRCEATVANRLRHEREEKRKRESATDDGVTGPFRGVGRKPHGRCKKLGIVF